MISKKITIDVARFDNSVRGSVSYNSTELDRQHSWDISKLPQGALLELRVHSYRPFRYPSEYGPAMYMDPHNWQRPDLHIIINADSHDAAQEWEDLFADQFRSMTQHKPAA
ncbi:hypothetical protein RI444_07615 [Paenarthrobacter sp. AT5]|uniref:hypothetical protein n=1 Tax=Paenarthrobacter TaxID=1742992 RepID=UPI001A99CC68|nr:MULTISPECIES: hypothetical protein [Paenarthrobacter]QSZ54501.1 hypothetical protein AYX19_16945 [Paenarthrobacter ureafaciens]WOC62478.1 hypothetical protein RI444_07615 [Paenarthrobacter sp. AT5]